MPLVNHGKYNQTISIGHWEEHQKCCCYRLLFSIYLSSTEGSVCIKVFSKTALELWKDIIKMIWRLPTYELLKYFRGNKQNTNWSIIIFYVSGILFEKRCYICKFDSCKLENLCEELQMFLMLWWFLYFNITCKVEWLDNLFYRSSLQWYSGIFRFFTIFEKKSLKVFCHLIFIRFYILVID